MQNLSLQPSTPIYDLPKTIVLSMVLLAVFFASQLIGVVLFAPWVLQDAADLDIAEKVLQGSENGTLMSLALGFTLVMVLGCVYLFIRFKNSRVKDYLALKPFTWYQLLQCSALLIVLNVIINLVTVWLGREPMMFMDNLAESAHPRWLLVLAMVVFAPIYEEVIFRGFMWTGLASSKLGMWGASVLTSILFAVIHMQYGVVELLGIFCLAMLFSYGRIISGSLLLPVVLHMMNNGLAMAQYLYG